MSKLTNKQTIWVSIIIMAIGIAFLIWGGKIYRAYPGMDEARKLQWIATKSAGVQYLLGIATLWGGYFYFKFKSK